MSYQDGTVLQALGCWSIPYSKAGFIVNTRSERYGVQGIVSAIICLDCQY